MDKNNCFIYTSNSVLPIGDKHNPQTQGLQYYFVNFGFDLKHVFKNNIFNIDLECQFWNILVFITDVN